VAPRTRYGDIRHRSSQDCSDLVLSANAAKQQSSPTRQATREVPAIQLGASYAEVRQSSRPAVPDDRKRGRSRLRRRPLPSLSQNARLRFIISTRLRPATMPIESGVWNVVRQTQCAGAVSGTGPEVFSGQGGRSFTSTHKIMNGRMVSAIATSSPSRVIRPILYVVYPRKLLENN
jgi:hypothetical protein